MKLSEVFAQLKDCQSDPDMLVAFEGRPPAYELVDVEFRTTIKAGTLAEFDKAVKDIKGPRHAVLVARVPERSR